MYENNVWAKKKRIEPFREELERTGVSYEPIVFSTFGRPHEKAVTFMHNLAQQVARRKGTEVF